MVHPEVEVEQGRLRGSTATDLNGNTFFKFQGIPFAKPPLGELRFKAPVPAEKWTGVLDATKEGSACFQSEPLKNGAILGSENCLFLNVYTSKIPNEQNKGLLPVLFWIHGGGFFFGSGGEEFYGPDYLITQDVVVVTTNYRLGLFGFLSFEDPSLQIPGNAGLKDQVLALKWVQKNISKFGGDPNNVTIFGESAGAAAVHLQVLSPMSKGLFHKAICQSGCVLNGWARGTRGCDVLATHMGLSGADEKTIYNALMKKSVEEIFKLQTDLLTDNAFSIYRPIGFVVEKNSPQPFLDTEPMELMASGRFTQVPFMLGYTTAEGMLFDLLGRNFSDLESYIPLYFGYESGHPETKIAAEKIKKFYSGDEKGPPGSFNKKYDLLSDIFFIYGIHVTILTQLQVSKSPIYLYRMSIVSELNFFKKHINEKSPGVSHLDDVGYLFKQAVSPEVSPNSLEDVGLRRFIKLWTNFAKFGNPTPDNENDSLLKAHWKPITGPEFDFLDIGEELVPMKNPDPERMTFWKKFLAESPLGKQAQGASLKSSK